MPSINGGMKLVKYLLFLFNLVFVVFGITLVWLGFSVRNGFSKYFQPIIGADDGGHSIPPTLLIVVGFVMFIIAFLGCCGAVTENHCMMMLYSVLVGLILVIQLGAAIAAYAFQDDFESALAKSMENSMNLYYGKTNPELHNDTVESWNFLQSNLKCCGVHNYTDWAVADGAPDSKFVPESCCINGAFDNCTLDITKTNVNDTTIAKQHVYLDGCYAKGVDSFSISSMGTVGIIFAVVELVAVILACMMARSIRFSYETV